MSFAYPLSIAQLAHALNIEGWEITTLTDPEVEEQSYVLPVAVCVENELLRVKSEHVEWTAKIVEIFLDQFWTLDIVLGNNSIVRLSNPARLAEDDRRRAALVGQMSNSALNSMRGILAA